MICCTIYAHQGQLENILVLIQKQLGFFHPQLNPAESSINIQTSSTFSKQFGQLTVLTKESQPEEFARLISRVIQRAEGLKGDGQQLVTAHLHQCQCAVGIAYDDGMSRQLFPNLLELCRTLDGIILLENGDFLTSSGEIINDKVVQ